MRNLARVIEDTVGILYVKALKELPPDVSKAIAHAARREKNTIAKKILKVIRENIRIAEERGLFICQDTGIPVCIVGVGKDFPLSLSEIERSLRRGVAAVTRSYPIRPNILDTVTRKRTFSNVGARVPVIYYEPLDKKKIITLSFIPKGSGSENMSFLRMFTPAQGLTAVKRFIIECVAQAGANPCPPVIVGVGLGGTADECMRLAKKAAVRDLSRKNPNRRIAGLESELLRCVNKLGIGPMGLGGSTTALAVNIEKADTHISLNPVAINMQCWAARRSAASIDNSGMVRYG